MSSPDESRGGATARWASAERTVAIGLAFAVLGGLAVWASGGRLVGRPPAVRSEIALPEGVIPLPPTGVNLDLSPDGSRITFVGISLDRSTRLWESRAEGAAFAPVADTEAARNPRYSPDGRSLAFTRQGTLYVLAEGEPPLPVADRVNGGYGIDWGPDGWLYYFRQGEGWSRVLPTGGGSERVDHLPGEDKGLVDVLPGGAILYTLSDDAVGDRVGLAKPDGELVDLGPGAMGRFAGSGHIVYTMWDGTLHTRTLHLESLTVGRSIGSLLGRAHVAPSSASYFAVSTETGRGVGGAMIHLTPGAVAEHASRLVWVDRSGNEEPLVSVAPDAFTAVALSPDGGRVAASVATTAPTDLWLVELETGARVRLTAEPSTDLYPTWSPDGGSVVYVAALGGTGRVQAVVTDGGSPSRPTIAFDSGRPATGVATTPERGSLVVAEDWPGRRSDLVSLDAGSGTVASVVATDYDERAPAVSPDGRWLAYVSDASGAREVYVRARSIATGSATQVSLEGGEEPVWSKAAPELFYRDPSTGYLVAAAYRTDPGFSITARQPLFDAAVYRHEAAARAYDVDERGERFLMMRPTADAPRSTRMFRVDEAFAEIRRSGSDTLPIGPDVVFIAMPLLIFATIVYGASRVSLGLTPRGALRRTGTGFLYLATMLLAVSPILLIREPDVARGTTFALAMVIGAVFWARGRQHVADAGNVLLSIPDIPTRSFVVPSALFAALGAFGWSFRPGMGWGGRMAVGVVCLVAALLALRARSATVELRERGIVRLGHVLDWRKVESFAWSPHAESTLMLRVTRRLPIFREYPLRVPPGSRDEVVQVLRDRLGPTEHASDASYPSAGAHA